ncbi:hypothetical protein M407DRAFT_246426, partial [Tulasnella calospora MUT 4182]
MPKPHIYGGRAHGDPANLTLHRRGIDYKQRSAARGPTPYLYIVRFDLTLGEFQRPQRWDSRTLT